MTYISLSSQWSVRYLATLCNFLKSKVRQLESVASQMTPVELAAALEQGRTCSMNSMLVIEESNKSLLTLVWKAWASPDQS